MVDQSTSWRSKAGGHKTKATKWWKSFLHYLLFGILVVNAFLNMKLANKNDTRSFRAFKKSLIRYSRIHVQDIFSKRRKRRNLISQNGLIEEKETENLLSSKIWGQKPNPYKTEVGGRHRFSRKLKAAAACLEHDVMRSVPSNMLQK